MSSDDERYPRRSVTPADLKGILMAQRVTPTAKLGSLLKAARKPGAKRERKPDYLALIRRCPCLGCDADPAGEAAHLRLAAAHVKPITGIGIRPDDLWALPLHAACHRRQHEIGELSFWHALGLDPIAIALSLHAQCPSIERMRAVIFKAREYRK